MGCLRCKICGGTLDYKSGDKIATCEYCGTKQTLPNITDDLKIVDSYNRAEKLRSIYEFDNATQIYRKIASETPNDAEVYWDLALCSYGIVYEKDPANGNYVPTCNRTQLSSILTDDNYLRALSLADEEQKSVFKSDAEYIDKVQTKILKIAKSEKPFDIFICYKETNELGKRTKDSVMAQELYDNLTAAGYKVFFSRITLESKVGIEYEPYIYSALISSKVMIHITSSKENSESVWVKNEWSRFLALATQDHTKQFIPVYFDMQKADLPKEFSAVSAYDAKEEGFLKELLRGIKKLIPTPIIKKEKRRKARKVTLIAAVSVLLVAGIGLAISFPKIKLYQNNKRLYENALKIYYSHDYISAKHAFEKIINFKDSNNYIKQCDISRRKQLAKPVAFNAQITDINYVDKNGILSHCSVNNGGSDSANSDQSELAEHGKAITVLQYDPVFHDISNIKTNLVLYEDGYISNLEKYYQIEDINKWHDIMKIEYAVANYYLLALRNDGILLCAKLKDENDEEDVYHYEISASWINEINDWSQLKDFSVMEMKTTNYNTCHSVIIGVNENGGLLISKHYYCGDEEIEKVFDDNYKEYLTKLKKVDSICAISGDSYAAICEDELIVIDKGEIVETDIKNIVDFATVDFGESFDKYSLDSLIYLNDSGELIRYINGNTIAYDIIDASKDGFITKSGELYYNAGGYYSADIKKLKLNVIVFNEWLERMN